MCDDEKIIKMSKEKLDIQRLIDRPILLTVANLRTEKNYIRQVEVMKKLKDRGVRLVWYNIGSTANTFIYQQVNSLIHKYNLEKDFILFGVDHNPYKYMAIADAVTVLSDFESWSLVITEAKIIGVPIIATKTSGAVEQLIDNKTGILTEFTTDDIVDKIQYFLSNIDIKKDIRYNLQGFATNQCVMKEFSNLIGDS
jgi:glycosyltransferase involved in cell wall biosynthesis